MIAKTKYIPDGKKALKELPIIHYLDAEYVYYPVTSARCPEGETCVRGGQFVKVGEVVGTRKGAFFEQPMHATVSGEVVGNEKHIDNSGKVVDCLIVKNDKKYDLHPSIVERTDVEIAKLTKEDYIQIVKDAGLVGLGGSAFPTYIKLDTKDPIDGVIAIKKKYKEIEERLKFVLQEFTEYDITVETVGNYYPQGWELAMIKNALGIKIPQGQLLSKYGVLNFNVSTLQSIYNAVKKRLPVLERLFTISGDGIHNKSFRARIGTLVTDLIELAGGYKDEEQPKVMVLGGPMMGTNILRDDVVMTHTTTSLIVMNEKLEKEEPCVHCASCVYSCPVEIQPVQIMNAYKTRDKDALKMLEVNKCIECGLCSYVCPSKIHLTEYMRNGKRFAGK